MTFVVICHYIITGLSGPGYIFVVYILTDNNCILNIMGDIPPLSSDQPNTVTGKPCINSGPLFPFEKDPLAVPIKEEDDVDFRQAIQEEFEGNEGEFNEAKLELESLIDSQAEDSIAIRKSLHNFLIAERLVRALLMGKTGYTRGPDLSDFITAANDLHNKLLEAVGSTKHVDFHPFEDGYRKLPSEKRPAFVNSLMDLIMSIREGIICALPVSANIKTAFRALIKFDA